MLTLPAFLLAIGVLVAIHEYGHYRMAVACGVRVLRFSIGFGKPVFTHVSKVSGTEFVLAMIPLGGFVKMLDEREAAVPAELRHQAFNTQPLHRRAAIVAAGPLANLGLAVLLYAVVNWAGVSLPAPVLSQPQPGTLAQQSGIAGGERVLDAALDGDEFEPVQSFEDLRWLLTQASLKARDVRLKLVSSGSREREVLLPLSQLEQSEIAPQLFAKIGLTSPLSPPLMGQVMSDGAAARAGLREGDLVLAVDNQPIVDGQQLRRLIRLSGEQQVPSPQRWLLLRGGRQTPLQVTPERFEESGQQVGRIGAYVGGTPEQVTVRYGLLDGFWRAMNSTCEVSDLSLKMIGKMLMGQASLKNISGPLTIADYAGKSASFGLTQYLVFLALISVSLGILNLLPIPILDGGHLMYYLWEGVTGHAVSDNWMQRLQQGGMAILMVMMSIALFNDFSRFFA